MASISLTLGKGLTKRAKKFSSYEALNKWSEEEEYFWESLQENSPDETPLGETTAPADEIIKQHQNLQAQYRALDPKNINRRSTNSRMNKIAAEIHLVSKSPEGQFLARTAWEGRGNLEVAMGVLSGFFPAGKLTPRYRKIISDEIKSWNPEARERYKSHAPELLKAGVSSETQYFNLMEDRINHLERLIRKKEDISAKRDETSRRQVETLLKDIEAAANASQKSLEKSGLVTIENMREVFKQSQDNWADKEASFEANIKSSTTKLSAIDEKTAKADSEFDGVLVALRAKLQLEEGANYWDKKAEGHDKVKFWMSIVLTVYAIGTVLCVYLLGRTVLSDDSTLSVALTNTVSPRSIFLLGMIGVVYTIVFWGGRILTRITLGHIHLANDAKERGVVMQTYLALQSDSNVTPEERQIMLSTVFRPSTDGVVRDDAAPMNTLAAAVVKKLTP